MVGFGRKTRLCATTVLSLLKQDQRIYFQATPSLAICNKNTYRKIVEHYNEAITQTDEFCSQVIKLLNSHPFHNNLNLLLLERKPEIVSELADFFGLPYLAMHLDVLYLQRDKLRTIEIELIFRKYSYYNKLPKFSKILKIISERIKDTCNLLEIAKTNIQENIVHRLLDIYCSLITLSKILDLSINSKDNFVSDVSITTNKYLLVLNDKRAAIEKILCDIFKRKLEANKEKFKELDGDLLPCINYAVSILENNNHASMLCQDYDWQQDIQRLAEDFYSGYIVCCEFLRKVTTEIILITDFKEIVGNGLATEMNKITAAFKQIADNISGRIKSITSLANKLSLPILSPYNQQTELTQTPQCEIINTSMLGVVAVDATSQLFEIGKIAIFEIDVGIFFIVTIVLLFKMFYLDKNKK